MSKNKIEPGENRTIKIYPMEVDITKGFTSSAPPPKPQVILPKPPKEKK
jgi:hypothetical protein